MKNKILLALLFLLSSLGIAQSKDSKDLVFKVKGNGSIKITPSTSFLLLGKSKTFRITAGGSNAVSRVEVAGGSVEAQRGGLYKISPAQSEQIMVNVYAKNPSGLEFIAKVVKYQVIPSPVISIMGVQKDYAITRNKLVLGNLSATSYELGKPIQILSFEVQTDTELLSSNSSSLSTPMRKYANTLQDGSIMWFYKIRCLFPDGTEELIPFFRVYVLVPKKNSTL